MSQKKGFSLLGVTILVGSLIGSIFLNGTVVRAADGSGTSTVSPTSTTIASTGNAFSFTFTAAEAMHSGGFVVSIPSGFSAPQGVAGTPGYVTASSTAGIIGNVLARGESLAESIGTWSVDDNDTCNTSFGVSSVQKVEGASSIRCGNAGSNNPDNGDSFSIEYPANQNWTAYTQIGVWVRVSVATNATDYIRLAYDNAVNMNNPSQELDLTALAANTWTYVTMNLTATRNNVRSFGVVCVGSGCDNRDIYVDYVLIGPGTPTFSGSSPWSINVPFVSMPTSGTTTVAYGNGGGASGVTVPSVAGIYTATTTSRTAVSGTLTGIAFHPTITIKNPPPLLTAISPTSAEAGSGTTTVTLIGSGFIPSSVVRWNGSDRPTTFASSTQLSVSIPSADLITTGTSTISVFNAAPGGGTSASLLFVVTPKAVRFEIIDPSDGTVDAPITITIRAVDTFGQVVPNFNKDVTLETTGSAIAGPTLVDIEDGIGTTQVSDTIAETITLTLSDTQATGLITTSTQIVTFGTGTLAKLLLSDATSASAGDLAQYTVTRTDQYENPITTGTTMVTLSRIPTSTAGIFYASNATSGPSITSLAIGPGNAAAQFWYYEEAAGSYQVVGQSGTVIGYDAITIIPAPIAKFTLNDRTSMNPGSRMQYTITRRDRFNNAVKEGASTVYMYAEPNGPGTAFYDAATGGNIVTTATIAHGRSKQYVWYYEEASGPHMVTVSDNAVIPDGAAGVADATDSIMVQHATATRFVFSPDPEPQVVPTGNDSQVTIQAQDIFGNIDTQYQNDVTLVTGVTSVSGPGLVNGQALIDIVNGEGVITLTNTIAETVDLALADTQGTGLDTTDTTSIVWNPGTTAQFTLTDQDSMVAGNSVPYVITRKDLYGNIVSTGNDLVYLYTNSAGTQARFQSSATGTDPIAFTMIVNGSTSTMVWYYDNAPGAWDVVASDHANTPDGTTGIGDAIDSIIVTPEPIVADRYEILDPEDAGVHEAVIVVIKAQDANGALDTSVQEDIYLMIGTSSAQAIGLTNGRILVDIIDGVGTATITNDTAETVRLSLDRIPNSTSTLAITSEQEVIFFVRQIAPGGAASVPEARFTGRAYPGATITLFARLDGQDIPLTRSIEVRSDGTFTVDFSGALRGLESFGLIITDKTGNVAQIKTYAMNKLNRSTEAKDLYIAPTARLIQRTVTIGNNIGITGAAAPNSMIAAEVDGRPMETQTQADKNGSYRLLVNTQGLDYGSHIIRVKQIDRTGIESDWSPTKTFIVSRTLATQADLNNNGSIDIGDWSIFLTKFTATDMEDRMRVDLNSDDRVDISDLSIFIRSAGNK